MKAYPYPVWATQGGGLARQMGKTFIFIEKPDCPGLDVGDDVPEEWDLQPVNEPARNETEDPYSDFYDQALFDEGVDELFNGLFEKYDAGEIDLATVRSFFPDEIQKKHTPEEE